MRNSEASGREQVGLLVTYGQLMARLWSAYGGFSDNFGPRCLTHSGVRVMFTARDGLHKSITDAKLGQPNYFTQRMWVPVS